MTKRSMRSALVVFLMSLCANIFAQPADWVVVPSAYEFSMTVTFTISVDGLVGAGSQNAAAIFDGDGNCRGMGTTDFLASNGYYTGLMLVYGNQTTEANLEVRVWDAGLDSLPQCDNLIDFVANGIVGSLSSPDVFYAVYDPLIGCTDPTACNFMVTAITDNGSCIFPGCDDPDACNFVAASPCYDNTSCTYPEEFFDCAGNCLSDFDADGICDEFEVGGCQDDRACNFNPEATDDDCSCEFPFYPYDCNGDCYLDTDGDGVCEADEMPGCDDPIACNYDPSTTDNDGSCTYCCYGIYDIPEGYGLDIVRFAGLGTEEPGIPGMTTYRIYLTCATADDRVLSVTGSGGESTFIGSSSGFYQSDEGALMLTDIDSTSFADDLQVTLDSWLTIGLDQPGGSAELSASTGIWSTLFELGEDLFIGGSSGDGWSLDSAASDAGLAGENLKVLLGQFTTAGVLEGSLNIAIQPAGGVTPLQLTPLFVAPPCGCMDEGACNYEESNTYDDGTCIYALPGLTCVGNCEADADGDGICDGEEIVGCTDFNADNYDPLATDDGNCDYLGCTYAEATNFNPDANVDDGNCTFELESSCPTDIDNDGITAASDILSLLATYGVECD